MKAARPPSPTGRLLNAQDAAKYVGIPYTTLRDLALGVHGRMDRDTRAPVLPCVRIPGCRRLWFDRADLDAAIQRWKR